MKKYISITMNHIKWKSNELFNNANCYTFLSPLFFKLLCVIWKLIGKIQNLILKRTRMQVKFGSTYIKHFLF